MTATLEQRIRAVMDERSLLKHPFCEAWAGGTLPRGQLQEYARQYYHFELAFPRFLSLLHARADSATVRQLLLENLWDEEHGARNHVALWLEFAAAAGASKRSVAGARANAATEALIAHFWRVCREAPLAEGLATLFAFEGQVPSLAWEAIKGLSGHYHMKPEQFEFFSVHLVSDVSHAGAEMQAIIELAEDEDAVVAAAARSCDLLGEFFSACSVSGHSRRPETATTVTSKGEG